MTDRSWYPAPSVAAGLAQATAQWPHRNRASDGIIGDAAHAATVSDHNPDSRGMVHAFDLTHDPAHGVDTKAIAEAIRVRRDPRIRYVISFRRIFLGPWSGSVMRGEAQPWEWADYTGADPHESHVHVSVGYAHAPESDTSSWYPRVNVTLPAHPVLRQGDSGPAVARLQSLLRCQGYALAVDGDFGPGTFRAVEVFQHGHKLTPDGVVGPATWAVL